MRRALWVVLAGLCAIGCAHPVAQALKKKDLAGACRAKGEARDEIPKEALDELERELRAQSEVKWKVEAIPMTVEPLAMQRLARDAKGSLMAYRVTLQTGRIPAGIASVFSVHISQGGRGDTLAGLEHLAPGRWYGQAQEPPKPLLELLPPQYLPKPYRDEDVPGHYTYRKTTDGEKLAWALLTIGAGLLVQLPDEQVWGGRPPSAKERAEFKRQLEAEEAKHLAENRAAIEAVIARNRVLVETWQQAHDRWAETVTRWNEPPQGDCKDPTTGFIQLGPNQTCTFMAGLSGHRTEETKPALELFLTQSLEQTICGGGVDQRPGLEAVSAGPVQANFH